MSFLRRGVRTNFYIVGEKRREEKPGIKKGKIKKTAREQGSRVETRERRSAQRDGVMSAISAKIRWSMTRLYDSTSFISMAHTNNPTPQDRFVLNSVTPEGDNN